MQITMTLLVRDEVDVIESMLEYHLSQGIDKIIVTDNGSIDGTLAVLQRFEKWGSIELLQERPADFSQHRWVTRMANLAYTKYGADWVLHADADELFVPSKHASVREYLEEVPISVSVLNVGRHDFVAISKNFCKSPFIEMIYRKKVSLNLAGQPLPPKVAHRGAENVIVSQGNHAIRGPFEGATMDSEGLEIYHYPIRSYAQFESKVRNGGSGYKINTELDEGIGFHKRYWYDLLQNGQLKAHFLSEKYFDEQLLDAKLASKYLEVDTRIAELLVGGTNG